MSQSSPAVSRWLYRCIHEHGHEIKPAIREKYTEIEQMRLEAGFGCINDPEPGDSLNWVAEADIGENGVSWINVKDKSCALPSDDEIMQKVKCAGVSPSVNKSVPPNISNSAPPSINNSVPPTINKCVVPPITIKTEPSTNKIEPKSEPPAKTAVDVRGRNRQRLILPIPNRRARSQSVGGPSSYLPRNPNQILGTTSNLRVGTAMRSGIMKRSSLPLNKMESSRAQSVESTQPNHQMPVKKEVSEPEVEVVTVAADSSDGELETARSSIGTSVPIPINVRPYNYASKKREEPADGDSNGVTVLGPDDIHQMSPIRERETLLREFKSRNGQLPDDLILLTYFFKPPVTTYKRKNQDFYKDVVTRFVPIVKITMVGRSEVEYNEPFIVDWGSDFNIAPQYGFSKKMTRDVVRRAHQGSELQHIHLRWRNEKTFGGSDYVKIDLRPDIVSSAGKILSAQLYAKLIVAESFEIPYIILGYTFLRNYIAAVDLATNHLYLINRNEEDVVMRFDIEEWVTVDEIINRSTSPPAVYLRSTATKLKLYNKPYPGDPFWYPIRNEALEEIAPMGLLERTDIPKFDACNTGIFSGDYSPVPEDERYAQITGLTRGPQRNN